MRSRFVSSIVCAGVVAGTFAAAPAGAADPPVPAASPSSAPSTAGEAMELTVMSFNIWVGGTRVDFGQVSAAIEAAGADIVGIQESGSNLDRLAADLGWDHVYQPQQIISRFPISETASGSTHVLVEVRPGEVVAVSNVHLRAYPYGPYELRDGATVAEVLADEQFHMNQMASRFDALPALAEAGVPVFLTGDFNVPSHLDWTAATAAATPRDFDAEIAWPVSVRLDELAFRDTFREAHPDPIATPGYTWTPGYPPPTMTADEVHDRIDFVYAAGPSVTLASNVVGEPPRPADAPPLPGEFGYPHTHIEVDRWPSDHRAVATTFEVTPAPKPATVDAPVAVVQGETLSVTANGPGNALDWVGIYRPGQTPRSGTPATDWKYLASNDRTEPVLGVERGTVTFPTGDLAPGTWMIHFLANGGYDILASTQITVRDPNEVPQLTLDSDTYAVGESIVATWEQTPGGATDWIGIYDVGVVPSGNPASHLWTYIADQTSGSVTLGSASTVRRWPLPPGEYAVHVLLDDGYEIAASATFTVVDEVIEPVEPGEGDQTIIVTVPEVTEPGEFVWSIDGDPTVTMTDAVNAGSHLDSTGELTPIVVTDTRQGRPEWSLSGQVSDFTGGVSGRSLGWTPIVSAPGAGAVAGSQVESGLVAGNGLTDASTLASADAGHDGGSARLGADLHLQLPIDTPPGTYAATLTITALT